MPLEEACGGNLMGSARPSKVLDLGIFECDQDVVKFFYESVLAFHSLFMHLKSLVVVIEVLLMSFMPRFKAIEIGFDDGIDAAMPINGAHVLRYPRDFPACFLNTARTSVLLSNGD